VTIVRVEHDDWCAIWRTQRAAACDCTPNLVAPPSAAAKKGGLS
jgi:hypothetical protein